MALPLRPPPLPLALTVMLSWQHVVAEAAGDPATIELSVDRPKRTIIRGKFRSADEPLLLSQLCYALPRLSNLTLQRCRPRAGDLTSSLRSPDPSLSCRDTRTECLGCPHVFGFVR